MGGWRTVVSFVGVFVDVENDEEQGDDDEGADRDADCYCDSS